MRTVLLAFIIMATSLLGIVWADPDGEVEINGGNTFTNSTKVTLTLDASAVFANLTSAEMCISNTESSAWTNWEPYNTSKTWTLPLIDGVKTVYVKFRINTSWHPETPIYNYSDVFQDSITLDTTPPLLQITNPVDDGSQINSSTLEISWNTVDTGSGLNINLIRLLPDTIWKNVGTNTSYTFTELNNGSHTVSIMVVDNVGNFQTASVDFTVDTSPPIEPIVDSEESETPEQPETELSPTPEEPKPTEPTSQTSPGTIEPEPTPEEPTFGLTPLPASPYVAAGATVSIVAIFGVMVYRNREPMLKEEESERDDDEFDKRMIWTTYFDLAKPRSKGRKVPKSLAVQSPTTEGIKNAVVKLGLKYEIPTDTPISKAKTEFVFVEKKWSKAQTIREIARQLRAA